MINEIKSWLILAAAFFAGYFACKLLKM